MCIRDRYQTPLAHDAASAAYDATQTFVGQMYILAAYSGMDGKVVHLSLIHIYIYADARKGGLTPELRPLSTIIFVLVLVLLVIINRRAGKKKEV